MSLINKVAAIIDHSKPIDEVSYIKDKVSYSEDISILNLDFEKIIPAPPKNSSITTKKELEVVAKATKSRSQKEIELIYNVDDSPLNVFYPWLAKKGLTMPKSVINQLYNILEQYMYALKYHFNRARPEQLAPYYGIDINILFTDTHHTPSYPSGHTMYAEMTAHILSEFYPEHKKDFFELADYCALARILQGVHFPSDNTASKIATQKLFTAMRSYYDKPERAEENPFN